MPWGGTGGGPDSSVGGAAGDNGRGGGNSAQGWNDAGVGSYTRTEGGWVNSYNDRGQLTGSARVGSDAAKAAQAASNGRTNPGGGNTNSGNGNGTSTSKASTAAAAKAAAEAAAREAAAAAERQRQEAINTENTTRANLQAALQKATSSSQISALQKQIAGLGTLAPDAAARNKSLSDLASKSFTDAQGVERTNAISAAQNRGNITAAQGTAVTAARQAYNTAEASRMGGYDTRSTMGKIADVAKAAVGGFSLGGVPGALIGAGAATYNSFVNNTRGASSSTQTEGVDATKATVGNALSGMATGAIAGAPLGPLGMMAGAIWGGATAANVAPSLESLKGQNPNGPGGQTSTGSGPGQTLANGVRIGQGNGGKDSGGASATAITGGTVPSTGGTTPSMGTTTPTPGTGTGATDGGTKAGNSAFNNYLTELRKRQLDNLLSTGAGSSRTSGTALLGRVGAAEGAVGGLSGYVQTTLGGGKSLLGGAWSW